MPTRAAEREALAALTKSYKSLTFTYYQYTSHDTYYYHGSSTCNDGVNIMDNLKEQIQILEAILEEMRRNDEISHPMATIIFSCLERIKDAAMRVDCPENSW